MEVIDIGLQCHFCHFEPEFYKIRLVHAITRHKFWLETPNSHQPCILGYSRLVLKMEVIDFDLQNHFFKWTCTLKAARQLNALSRISKYLDTNSKSVLYHSFIASSFNYCPIVWHFCGVINNNKLDKILEPSLCNLLVITNLMSMIY